MTGDLDLLRKYEPIVRYTQGEMFLPCPVERYVERCSLWRRTSSGSQKLSDAGEVTLDSLAKCSDDEEAGVLSLKFVDAPLGGIEYQRWKPSRPAFQGQGRLARVGLGPRLLDALFSLSLFVRGRVPGGTTAGAAIQYEEIRGRDCRVPYYGRVVRSQGYFVLQYLFFYAMNDWRSSFSGVNDHEADWEQAFVFLEDLPAGPRPLWLACAAHDFSGSDLRRRWDDPELQMEGDHPIIFAGAGSHAAYFRPGEYLTAVEVKALRPLSRGAQAFRRLWVEVLHQGDPAGLVKEVESLVRVPFVDYARGDGESVGPGQVHEWTPELIGDGVGWVSGYPGLWGLDTEDIFAGELAPAGPRFTRSGSVRQSWYDPLGWAGLNTVPPLSRTSTTVQERITDLEQQIERLDRRAALVHEAALKRDVEVRADSGLDETGPRAAASTRLATLTEQLNRLEAERQQLQASIASLQRSKRAFEAGELDDPRAHLHRVHNPQPPEAARASRLAELWAAISVGVFLVAAALLLRFDTGDIAGALLLLIGGVVFIDNVLRRTVVGLLLNCTILLAAVTVGILVVEFAWQLALGGLAALGLLILFDNVRKLRAR